MLDDGLKEKVNAALAKPSARTEVRVKPLDESKNVGWTNDKGRFCLPLSCGYHIAFPKEGETSPLFMAWHHAEMVGGSHRHKEAIALAQEHHKRRILKSIELVRYEAEELVAMYDGCYVELRDGDSRGPVHRRHDVEPHMRPWICGTDAWFDNGGYRIQGGESPWDVVRVLRAPADGLLLEIETLARRIYDDSRSRSMGIDDPDWDRTDDLTRERFIGYAGSALVALASGR